MSGGAAPRRLARERRTMAAMIALYCRDHHGGEVGTGPCAACAALDAYAGARLEHCVYGTTKPTCARCPIHCYERQRREAIREVMQYAGPRMLLHHPILALRHILDGRRPIPPRPRRRRHGSASTTSRAGASPAEG